MKTESRFRSALSWIATAILLTSLAATHASAQSTGSITGRVISSTGAAAGGVDVSIVELRRRTTTSTDGTFRFDSVPPGQYLILVESPRLGSSVGSVQVTAGATAELEVELDLAVHSEQIVVSAGPESRAADDVYQPIDVVSGDELALRMQPTLGETLSNQPGVSSTYFGPASSRPVIRGLGGDRIRILEEGIGTGDASNVSPDHAVTFDPMNADRIEIVRGPATLLYGSNAVGGLVNIIDSRVPEYVPTSPIGGSVDLMFGTVADERSGGVALQGGAGSFAWNLRLGRRETDDIEIPGPAEHEDDHDDDPDDDDHDDEEFTGILENSALKNDSGSLGVSWVGDRAFFGVAVSGFDSFYGVPGHGHHEEEGEEHEEEEEEEEEEIVSIDMRQKRVDVRGEIRNDTGLFSAYRLRAGRTDYEHTELEGDEIGTLFTNEATEARIEAIHRSIGPFRGSIGIQLSNRDFSAVGAEAFVPPSDTDTLALFIFEETGSGPLRYQFGARYEKQDVSARVDDLPSRSFAGLSGSAGVIWRAPEDPYAVAVSVARAVRAPTAEELYANGPHIATRSFEIGNPDFDEETSLGIDLSFRKTEGRLKGELNLFAQRFDDFIFERPTGEEEDELPVFQFEQADARFNGAEAHADIELFHTEPHHFDLELSADYVRGSLAGGGNLPRITPLRLGAGLRYRGPRIWSLVEVRDVADQNRTADFEEETDGYTFLNAAIGYRFFLGPTIHELVLRGTNLTDELARSHVSPLKELAPLPGRDFSLAYKVMF